MNIWYLVACKLFASESYVSTALLQRFLAVPYSQARQILDRMIEDGFCEEQVGSMPCRVISNEKN